MICTCRAPCHVNDEFGIRGIAPVEGWAEEAHPAPLDELVAALIKETDLISLPRSTGTYQGAYLNWKLYSFVSRIQDEGDMLFRVDLATAKDDTRSYFCAGRAVIYV